MTSEEYNAKETETFNQYKVPQGLRGWLSHGAYERGHSSGMGEVLNCLLDMLDGFGDAWKKVVNDLETKVPEKTSDDAPVDYSCEEASCFSHGYASGREDVLKTLRGM